MQSRHDPRTPATLEAYLVHARALTDFICRTREVSKGTRGPYRDDGLADDYYAPPARWSPMPKPDRIEDMMAALGGTSCT
jgi:hypothetical protein